MSEVIEAEDPTSETKRTRGETKSYNFTRRYDKTRANKRRRCSSTASESKVKDDNFKAIVIDSGAYTIKTGLSNAAEPMIIPNCIMKAKSERKRLFIGNQITECRDCSGLYYLLPCERGYITKWDVQKPVWDYTFNKNVCPLDDYPVVMTQPLFNFKSIQDCIDEIFFEEYEINSMIRVNPSDLARLKFIEDKQLADDTPLIIIDSGFSFTHIIPYINGHKYLKGMRRLNVGGKLLTNHLKDIISYRQYNVMEETYVINQVKEDTCYVAEDVKQELKIAEKSGSENHIVRNYVLPDFNNIRRGYIQDPSKVDEKAENCQILRLNNERFVVPEILFHPSDIGMKSMGLAEAVVKCIKSCPDEHQKHLAKNILLIGGNTKFPGFKDRLYAELRSQLPQLWLVNIFHPDDPITYSWSGGNSLVKSPDFKSFLVTKEEYEEFGSSIIQQKFNHWTTCVAEKKEGQKKQEEEFSILDNIKGRTIFGKQENSGQLSASTENKTSSSSTSEETLSSSDNTESSNKSLDTSNEDGAESGFVDDSHTSNSETDNSVKKTLKVQSKIGAKPKKDINKDVSHVLDDEFTQSMDLFQFGPNSYL